MDINKRIKAFLRDEKMSQAEFARKTGKRAETVWRWVHGTSWPTRKTEKKILRIINGQ